jgi:hypothetical protein
MVQLLTNKLHHHSPTSKNKVNVLQYHPFQAINKFQWGEGVARAVEAAEGVVEVEYQGRHLLNIKPKKRTRKLLQEGQLRMVCISFTFEYSQFLA